MLNNNEKHSSSCGVGINISSKISHNVVKRAIKDAKDFFYRSGFNPVTGENDGSGILFEILPCKFFEKKIKMGDFGAELQQKIQEPSYFNQFLQPGQFAIGQYFLPTDYEKVESAKSLIENEARAQGLTVYWRDMSQNNATDPSVLSEASRSKMPGIWQALLLKDNDIKDIENAVQNTTASVIKRIRQEKQDITIVSQSSQTIVYKGMICSYSIGDFYKDLRDELFEARAAIVHARFATNTDPQWKNAQPCRILGHNGEFNSKDTNLREMDDYLRNYAEKHNDFIPIFSNYKFSDSMLLNCDITNLMALKKISLEEACVRLLTPAPNYKKYSKEINAMLELLSLERTPYNGPGLVTLCHNGSYLVKLDNAGLRPARICIVKNSITGEINAFVASDDNIEAEIDEEILHKGQMQAGDLLLYVPNKGFLTTKDLLERVETQIRERDNLLEQDAFQKALAKSLVSLKPHNLDKSVFIPSMLSGKELNYRLVKAGYYHESVLDTLIMAEKGAERLGAMGDDTDPLKLNHDASRITDFFHGEFCEVTAPPLDSVKETYQFSIKTILGPATNTSSQSKQVRINSPILEVDELYWLEKHPAINTLRISMDFDVANDENLVNESGHLMRKAISCIVKSAEEAVKNGVSVIILHDDVNDNSKAFIPDLIVLTAVRKHLEAKGLMRYASLVVDSYQINGPHHATTLLTMGASAVYPRSAFAIITQYFQTNKLISLRNYHHALNKCLLKTMGKVGINDVNNFINGQFVGAIGLNFHENISDLSSFFAGIYSPMGGKNLDDVAEDVVKNYFKVNQGSWDVLPRSGQYMPDKGGMDHGYDTFVVNTFSEWMKTENEVFTDLFGLDNLHKKLLEIDINSKTNSQEKLELQNKLEEISKKYTSGRGFLNPLAKNIDGFYSVEYLSEIQSSPFFTNMCAKLDEFKAKHPTSIKDFLYICKQSSKSSAKIENIQSTADIRKRLFSGHMSQGALTIEAHETFTRALNAVGANSAAGEGGESFDALDNKLQSTQGKQIASGRFGISAEQVLSANEIEIKIAQGAKPGEGGELPGSKVTIRYAAQRGGFPGIGVTSPPPHHDIYSIEDLEQLIHDIKSVKPSVNVSVKLVASKGIGTIAVGVAKAGADIINVAGNSGGTAAAQQSSIRHAGLPAEVGVAEVIRALRKAKLHNLVKIRSSGGYKTPEDIIKSAILGVQLFELGTTTMLTGGCKMQRTCDSSCEPGVANKGHLFKGQQIDTERYYVQMAIGIQEKLRELGVSNLDELVGRFDLLDVSPEIHAQYSGFRSFLLMPLQQNEPLEVDLANAKLYLQKKWKSFKEDELIQKIEKVFFEKSQATFDSQQDLPEEDDFLLKLTTQDRSWSARITGHFASHLNQGAKIVLKTTGIAGQSMGFVCHYGLELVHRGTVQDGCGKSMTGGKIILKSPNETDRYSKKYDADKNTIAGNALLYGASGGEAYINGIVGQRCGVLLKGATLVVEGVGDLAFEFMTSGTAMVLGKTGEGLCNGAKAGIVFVYGKDKPFSDAVRAAVLSEESAYKNAIKKLLENHFQATGSILAAKIISSFEQSFQNFNILIPLEMDNKSSLEDMLEILQTYELRKAPLTLGLEVWVIEKLKKLLDKSVSIENNQEADNWQMLLQIIHKQLQNHAKDEHSFFSSLVFEQLDLLSRQLFIKVSQPINNVSLFKKHIEKQHAHDKKIGLFSLLQWRLLREAFTAQIDTTPFIAFTGSACPAPCEESCTENIPEANADYLSSSNDLPHKLSLNVKDRITSISGKNDITFKEAIDSLKYYVAELTHNAAGCTSCRAQSCAGGGREEVKSGCPSGKPINTINTLLKSMQLKVTHAHDLDIEDLHLPLKPVGQGVHIKDIELILYHIGEMLGWFDEEIKEFSSSEIEFLFGGSTPNETAKNKVEYDELMRNFTAPFSSNPIKKFSSQEIIIVGSGPAAMEVAYNSLLNGLKVRMFERSDKPGGLLVDGIPAHKFNKKYINLSFARLQRMGLELYLNSEVKVNFNELKQVYEYNVAGEIIYSQFDKDKYLILAVGSGKPLSLPAKLTNNLPLEDKTKIIQAVDFLKAANDLAVELNQNPGISLEQKSELISLKLGKFDPRNKKVLVIGGGDTAQDTLRWISRLFVESRRNFIDMASQSLQAIGADLKLFDENYSENISEIKASIHKLKKQYQLLKSSSQQASEMQEIFINLEEQENKLEQSLINLVRNFDSQNNPPKNHYPFRHFAKISKENGLRNEEMNFVDGKFEYSVSPTRIIKNNNGKLDVTIEAYECLYTKIVNNSQLALSSADKLPYLSAIQRLSRANRPLEKTKETKIENVDLVFCAIGFEPGSNLDIVKIARASNDKNVFVVGDAADAEDKIIIGAQTNALKTFFNQILEKIQPGVTIFTKKYNVHKFYNHTKIDDIQSAAGILINSNLGIMSAPIIPNSTFKNTELDFTMK